MSGMGKPKRSSGFDKFLMAFMLWMVFVVLPIALAFAAMRPKP